MYSIVAPAMTPPVEIYLLRTARVRYRACPKKTEIRKFLEAYPKRTKFRYGNVLNLLLVK